MELHRWFFGTKTFRAMHGEGGGERETCLQNRDQGVADSLADEPVLGEPVSGSNSLLTGKITGNFTKIGPFGETVPVKMQQNQLVIGQFPTKLNRELIRAEQGIY
jgi:hypothetical protein